MGNMWHVKNWFRVGHNISWPLNFHTLFSFLGLSLPCRFFFREAERKHAFILSYLKRELPDVIEKYRHIEELPEDTEIPEKRYIWLLWWQGEETAPPLVRSCISSTRENANGADVVIITKDNFSSYIDIPSYILEKKEKGYISFAQLSDIIRYMLLSRYGGLWLDATVYTASPVPPEYFAYNFFSQHTKPAKHTCWVQNNAYHGFIVASRKGAKLASFMNEMFLEYWKRHDTLVDYLMIDYMITLAMQEFPEIREEIENLPFSSERLYDLVHMLDEPFDEREFCRLKEECIFSKLDWHKKYRTESRGRPTYFAYITKNM